MRKEEIQQQVHYEQPKFEGKLNKKMFAVSLMFFLLASSFMVWETLENLRGIASFCLVLSSILFSFMGSVSWKRPPEN